MLWKLSQVYSNPRRGKSRKVQLIEDGGENQWNVACCHLNQHALKEKFVTNEEENNYLKRTMNPKNPFLEKVEEDITYSKEHGCLTIDKIYTPQTIFHLVKRTNRTLRDKEKTEQAQKEKANAEAVHILTRVLPTSILEYPK